MDQPENRKNWKSKKQPLSLDVFVNGKIPPQANKIEEAILGACMIEAGAFDKAIEILQPECFYVESHQKIFKSFLTLKQKSCAIDMLTVIECLVASGELEQIGGAFSISKLTNDVSSGANIIHHSRIVFEKFLKRQIIRIGAEIINDGYDESQDIFNLLDIVENKLSSLASAKAIKPYKTIQSLTQQAIETIYHVKNTKQELTGVPSGIGRLDLVTQGWQPTNLIVLAARPAVGKSAVAANFAINAATDPVKPTGVGIFSLEMPGIQWAMRILSSEAKIQMWDMKRGRVSDQDMLHIESVNQSRIGNAKILLDDTSGLDLFQLKSKARMMVLKDGVGLIIIDYLQLMGAAGSQGGNREQEISKISRELKQLAKELNVPVIALSQLSRAGDTSDPGLSTLRESGAIEQDADDVLFLIPVDDEMVKQDATLKDSILVKIAKHRNGVLEKIPIKFAKDIQKLMSEYEYENYILSQNGGRASTTITTKIPGGNWTRIDPIHEQIPIAKGMKFNPDQVEYNDSPSDDLEDLPF